MTIYTKPCARASRGCRRPITVSTPYMLKRQQYCSKSCHTKARMERGWVPQSNLNRALRSKGGYAGGVASGHVRRHLAAVRLAERLEAFWAGRAMAPADLPMLKLLLVKAWRAGYTVGYAKAIRENRETRRR